MDNTSSLPLGPPAQPLGWHSERRDRGGLRRIRDLRFAELAYRGWQEAFKWLDRVAPIELPDHPEALLRKHAPELADAAEALRVLRDAAPKRFFGGVEDADTPVLVAARFKEHRAVVIAAAERLLTRDFDLVDDEALSRQQWLVTLAQAWTLTREEKYAEACVRTIDAWLVAHPPGAGVQWVSSVDVSMRLVSWCWTVLLVRDSKAVTAEWTHRFLAAIWLHASHVRRYLSYYYSRDTDLTGEALGLFYAATLFPQFRDADTWRDVAMRIFVTESEAQVSPDGVHFEQSTCYHRYTVDMYLHFLLLADRLGLPVADQFRDRVRLMVDFLVALRDSTGCVPAIGDDDGGTVLSLTDRASGDTRGTFAVAATIFGRRDFAWAADGAVPEVVWLMGADGLRRFEAIPPTAPATDPSRVFPHGGYVSMRSGWARDDHHVIVDIGPIGCPVSGGHGHADLLSLQCSIFGEPCLVDAGTYSYTGDSQWRDFFRSTAAHSTVLVDGLSQSEPAGSFGWRHQPRVKLREWHSTPEFDFLDAEHDGYLALPDPVIHRRRVIFVKPGYWIVVDDLSGQARHQLDLTFQFAPLVVTLGAHPWARAQTPKGRVLWICPFPSAPVQPALKCGELSPIRGWISRDYGQRHPAPMLIYSFAVALPWRIVTLLLPDRQGQPTPPGVRAIYDETGRPTGVAFERPRRVVRFDDRAVSVERE